MRRFLLLIVLTVMRCSIWINCYPVSINPETNAVYKPRLDIYKRQNSEFNRLITNNDDFSGYYGFNDQKPIRGSPNNRITVNADGSQHRQSKSQDYDYYNQNEIMDQAESRIRKILKKRPCVPVYENALGRRRNERIRNSGRTLYDLNFYFLGYQPTKYQVAPVQSQQTGTAEEFSGTQSDSNHYNHYGGYDCTPNPFFRPPLGFGGSGTNGAYSDSQVANRPNFLGLFGQGLYDFLNGFLGYGNPNAGGGTSGPTSGAVLADQQSGGNDQRPVYEANVPDTIQALNPNNWRPGQVVGGIQNSVNGFVQELSRYIPF